MEELHWLVCHTRPRCEKRFAALLGAEKVEHYLPLIGSVRRYQQRVRTFTKPLFSGYVFARVADDRRHRLYQQELLARVLPVSDEAALVRQLDDVRSVIASGLELSVLPLLTKGRRVRILGGPLHGLEGFVDNATQPRGIVIAVDVLRQGLLIRMPAEQLRPLH